MRDENELAKQLNTYADGIAAFAVVQGIAFCLLVVQNVPVACAVRSRWDIAAPFVVLTTAVYLLLVKQCQKGEDELIGKPTQHGVKIATVVSLIRKMRFWIILVVGVGDLVLAMAVGLLPPIFDCSRILLDHAP